MLELLSTIGMVTGVIGAFILALNINKFILAYSIMLVSALTWLVYSVSTQQFNLAILNAVFAAINVMGLTNYSRGQKQKC